MKCKKCGYEWKPKKKNPKQCPNCKRYDYNTERKNNYVIDL